VDARKQQFVERMGLASEADGLPRIAGRIFARRLSQIGLIERRSRPGDRRDYYRSAPDAFRHSIERRIEGLRRFHALIDEARTLGVDDEEVTARLAAWDDAHRLLLDAFTRLLATIDAREGTR
jgi:DNA-binding MarR family transcriptional regulator